MIAFRVDANEQIATGHLMRCMAIALKLQELGEKTIFYVAENKYVDRLEKYQLPYEILNTKWDNLEEELFIIDKLIERDKPDWLVVDSYQVSAKYLASLGKRTRVLYMDDMMKCTYDVAAVVHYGMWTDKRTYVEKYEGSHTKVMVGAEYAPLRAEFYPGEEVKKKCILVSTGGTDLYNVAGNFLRIKDNFPILSKYCFYVIIGGMNRNKQELERIASKDKKIILYYDVNNMGELMRSCDYAVSAGGTTLYELCASKVSTVCFSFSENQVETARKMEENGVMYYAGDARDGVLNVVKKIGEKLSCMIENEKETFLMIEQMGKLVDGKGADRIAFFLMRNSTEGGFV